MQRQLSREERIALLATAINNDLEPLLDPAKLIDDDDPEKQRLIFNGDILPEKAVHFIAFMNNRILTRGLAAWLPAYLLKFGDAEKRRYVQAALRVVGDERFSNSVRYSLRHLGETISASELARNTFKKLKTPDHHKYRQRILTEAAPDLKEVGLWIVEEDPRGYSIKAGATLVDFNKHIFLYWAKRQAQFFCAHLNTENDDESTP
ncbi:hypothetical protein [Bradyrhizobium sp. USDA 329]|uniref:hypothetical protein n=1 Tax=unclassified Bradyrhizobium TaxID=2631580 RepID=UPI003519473F